MLLLLFSIRIIQMHPYPTFLLLCVAFGKLGMTVFFLGKIPSLVMFIMLLKLWLTNLVMCCITLIRTRFNMHVLCRQTIIFLCNPKRSDLTLFQEEIFTRMQPINVQKFQVFLKEQRLLVLEPSLLLCRIKLRSFKPRLRLPTRLFKLKLLPFYLLLMLQIAFR